MLDAAVPEGVIDSMLAKLACEIRLRDVVRAPRLATVYFSPRSVIWPRAKLPRTLDAVAGYTILLCRAQEAAPV